MVKRTDFEDLDRRRTSPGSKVRWTTCWTKTNTAPDEVDKVFLTGGTSFVPAVRRIFTRRFDEARIESGGELLSIAHGLALIGESDDVAQWAA